MEMLRSSRWTFAHGTRRSVQEEPPESMTGSANPATVHTAVVTASDLVSALETSYRGGGETVVLRITPPFSGRMRARLHRYRESDGAKSDAVHLDPHALVTDDCPVPPEPDDGEDALRTDPDATYTIDAHREWYQETLDQWRAEVPEHVREEVTLPGTESVITISILGTAGEA